MKIGIEVRIDVSKIDKARLYKGEKGTYLTMTAFVDPINQDQYGNNGMVTHKKNQDEQQAPILGNTKVFWSEGLPVSQQGGYQQQQNPTYQQAKQGGFQQQAPQQQEGFGQQAPQQQSAKVNTQEPDFDQDIPF